MAAITVPRNIRGAKWINGASYISDEDRQRVLDTIAACRREHPRERVGVRCPSYIGKPHPFAIVEYGAGRRIYRSIHREN